MTSLVGAKDHTGKKPEGHHSRRLALSGAHQRRTSKKESASSLPPERACSAQPGKSGTPTLVSPVPVQPRAQSRYSVIFIDWKNEHFIQLKENADQHPTNTCRGLWTH